MNKPQGYDEVVIAEPFEKLPRGGYICQILKFEECKNSNNDDQIRIYVDIADGEFKGYFNKKYNADLKTFGTANWGAVMRRNVLDSTTGKTSKGFKSFLTAVEESNAGFVVDKTWGNEFAKFYKGKFIGVIFNYYYGEYNGNKYEKPSPKIVVSTDRIKRNDFKIPNDDYAENSAPATVSNDEFAAAGFTPVSSDALPF